jgi:hypothetical protein
MKRPIIKTTRPTIRIIKEAYRFMLENAPTAQRYRKKLMSNKIIRSPASSSFRKVNKDLKVNIRHFSDPKL